MKWNVNLVCSRVLQEYQAFPVWPVVPELRYEAQTLCVPTLNAILFLYKEKAHGSELYALNISLQKGFSLQGIMGRPGPMGQVGTKGEKVSCITTEAHFFIL